MNNSHVGSEQRIRKALNKAIVEYYRCPEQFVEFRLAGQLSPDSGYFQFGQDTVCYGGTSTGFRAEGAAGKLYDTDLDVRIDGNRVHLPFDPSRIIENLRLEYYARRASEKQANSLVRKFVRSSYYTVRPLLPVFARKYLQRAHLRGWEKIPFPCWPVDRTVDQILGKLLALSIRAQGIREIPFVWFWPQGVSSCAAITHDVEGSLGRDFCPTLMDMNDSMGMKSSFQIIPEGRYPVSQEFLKLIRDRDFEINIHDLNHDGHLYTGRKEFLRRAGKINRYAREFGARGFRSGVLYRNVDWYDAFDFSYDMSIPNVAHLDPQRGGCCTVMPYFIGDILEIPLTTAQDYSLFHILSDYSIHLWKRQIELITASHGLISFNIHPDYIVEPRARRTYLRLLEYLVKVRSDRKIWIALPGEIDTWWRQRNRMELVRRGDGWQIEGAGSERARIAYASLQGDRLVYNVDSEPQGQRPAPSSMLK